MCARTRAVRQQPHLPTARTLHGSHRPALRARRRTLGASQILALRQEPHQAFVSALTRDEGWELVDEPGSDVLTIQGALVDLVVHAPPDSGPAGDRIYIDSAAEATLVVELFDSESGEILARVADRRSAGPAMGAMRSLPVRNRAEVRRMFDWWARMFRQRLDLARTLEPPEVP